MLTCRALLFDLDGVLVDSNPIAERHWRRWAAGHDVDIDALLAVHHGRPTVETIRAFAPHLDAAAEARVLEREGADDTDGLRAFDGAHALLAALPEARWAIATSGTRRTATARLRHTGLPVPRVLVTADDITHGKPHPEPYLAAARRLGFDPADCVVVEDAPAGVASANAAGARVLGIASGGRPETLREAHAVLPRLGVLRVEVQESAFVLRWDARA